MAWWNIFENSKRIKELNDELNLCLENKKQGTSLIQELQVQNASLRRQNEILRRDVLHLMSQRQPRDPKTGRMLPKEGHNAD